MTEKTQSAAPIEPLLVRVEEAARILCLSRSTIYEMLDRGERPTVRRGAAGAFRSRRCVHGWNDRSERLICSDGSLVSRVERA